MRCTALFLSSAIGRKRGEGGRFSGMTGKKEETVKEEGAVKKERSCGEGRSIGK